MIHVYLDDYRECPQGFVLASNADECNKLIDKHEIDILSLDYDLGWSCPTGYEVVSYLVKQQKYPRRIYLHTSSEMGRMKMYQTLSECIPASCQLFGGPMPHHLLYEVARK